MPPSCRPWKSPSVEADVDELLERHRVGGADAFWSPSIEHRRAAHGGHRRQLGDLRERLGDAPGAGLERLVGDDVVGLDAAFIARLENVSRSDGGEHRRRR